MKAWEECLIVSPLWALVANGDKDDPLSSLLAIGFLLAGLTCLIMGV